MNDEVEQVTPNTRDINDTSITQHLDIEKMTQNEINRCTFWVRANRTVRESGKHNFEKCKIPVNSNWNVGKFEEMLADYHDKEMLEYVKFGWPINVTNNIENQTDEVPKNQQGALQNPQEIKKYIENELQHGSIIGPFITNPFGKSARLSPIDTRPKRDSDQLRIIMNLSYPFGDDSSVNANINGEKYARGEDMKVHYPTVEDLCKIIKRKRGTTNKKVKIFMRDISRAYRQLWSCPGSIHLTGFTFQDRIYHDVTLSMGSKSSAYCCQRLSNSITYIFEKDEYCNVNYLDDLGGADIESKAEQAFNQLGEILREIGIQESTHKAVPPSFIATFLGILINLIDMTLEITPERRNEIQQLLEQWLAMKTATKKELQKLLGKLNFVCSTVRAGRVFITRIIEDMKKFPEKGKRRIGSDLKMDVKWWSIYMSEFDGISIIPDVDWSRPDEIFSTDASLRMCGGWSNPEYFSTEFPDWLLNNV